MIDFDLVLGFPPSLNNYYSRTKRGVFIKKAGKVYRELVAGDIQEQVGVIDRIVVPVKISLVFYPPYRRSVWDLDNHLKALQDALTVCGFWNDDSLVHQIVALKGEYVKFGMVKMHIAEALPVATIDDTPAKICASV